MTLTVGLKVTGDATGAKAALSETKAGLDKVKAGAEGAAGATQKSTDKFNKFNDTIGKGVRPSTEFGKSQRAAASHTANLTAQLNDIGVMLAAGQNPMQLALQQGTQINQVFAQMGGGANALRGIGGAFLSMLSPINLATIGIIGFGSYGVQAILKLLPETKTSRIGLMT